MIKKFRHEEFKSIDKDYKGQQLYHIDEKVKIVDPDNQYYNKIGLYKGYKKIIKDGQVRGYEYLIELIN